VTQIVPRVFRGGPWAVRDMAKIVGDVHSGSVKRVASAVGEGRWPSSSSTTAWADDDPPIDGAQIPAPCRSPDSPVKRSRRR
jgi:hypothetical protein